MTLLLPPPAEGDDSLEQLVRDLASVTYKASDGQTCMFCGADRFARDLNPACPVVRARKLTRLYDYDRMRVAAPSTSDEASPRGALVRVPVLGRFWRR